MRKFLFLVATARNIICVRLSSYWLRQSLLGMRFFMYVISYVHKYPENIKMKKCFLHHYSEEFLSGFFQAPRNIRLHFAVNACKLQSKRHPVLGSFVRHCKLNVDQPARKQSELIISFLT